MRLLDTSGELAEELSDYIGEATNNQAEYQALVAGLEMAIDHGVRRLTVFSDSELVVRQLSGEYKVKDKVLAQFHDAALRLLHQFQEVELKAIPREENAAADQLVNVAIDRFLGRAAFDRRRRGAPPDPRRPAGPVRSPAVAPPDGVVYTTALPSGCSSVG